MIHGLEAHATFVRAARSGCYPILNQAMVPPSEIAISPCPDANKENLTAGPF
jgi:hypothetical protein